MIDLMQADHTLRMKEQSFGNLYKVINENSNDVLITGLNWNNAYKEVMKDYPNRRMERCN